MTTKTLEDLRSIAEKAAADAAAAHEDWVHAMREADRLAALVRATKREADHEAARAAAAAAAYATALGADSPAS